MARKRKRKTPAILCSRFAFAMQDAVRDTEQHKRRLAVADYLLERFDMPDVVDEWEEDRNRWLVVDIPGRMSAEAVVDILAECPRYVRDSFAVDRAG